MIFDVIDLILIYGWLGFLTFFIVRFSSQNLKLHESNLRCIDAMQKILTKDVDPELLERFQREMDALKRRGKFEVHDNNDI